MMLNAPDNLSATEHETVIVSVGCKIILPPDNTSKLAPTGKAVSYTHLTLPTNREV